MKKIIALTLSALMLVAALAGCGGTASADANEYTVGICQLMVHESLDKATQGFIDALTADVEAAGRFDIFNCKSVLAVGSVVNFSFDMKNAENHDGFRHLARQKGFGPPTFRLGGGCSIQLSYWRVRDIF